MERRSPDLLHFLLAWSTTFSVAILAGIQGNTVTHVSVYCIKIHPWWLQVPKDYISEKHDIIDLVVAGHVIHGNGMKSTEFKTFLSQFPDWSYPVGWTSSYKAFVFWTTNSKLISIISIWIIGIHFITWLDLLCSCSSISLRLHTQTSKVGWSRFCNKTSDNSVNKNKLTVSTVKSTMSWSLTKKDPRHCMQTKW